MPYEQKDNEGTLFVNDKQSDKQPDKKGSAMIDGKEYWVSAWDNVSQNGKAYQKLKYTPKEEKPDINEPIDDDFNQPF